MSDFKVPASERSRTGCRYFRGVYRTSPGLWSLLGCLALTIIFKIQMMLRFIVLLCAKDIHEDGLLLSVKEQITHLVLTVVTIINQEEVVLFAKCH